ncbi:MAG: hypothetical protein NVS9B9_14020 [Ktedonobacteraceae bacterium]
MAADPAKPRYSFEQYISLLRNHEQRLEYDHGDIHAMAGSSANHAAISTNMWRALPEHDHPYIQDLSTVVHSI